MKTRTVEGILEEVGSFGRFQCFILTVCLSVSILNGATLYLMTYIGVQPRYHCHEVPINDTNSNTTGISGALSTLSAGKHRWLQNTTMPTPAGFLSNSTRPPPRRKLPGNGTKVLTQGNPLEDDLGRILGEDELCDADGTVCEGIHYEENISSIVTEWQLVCDYNWVPDTLISIQLVGYWLGAPIIGQLCDRFGRKKMMFLTLTLLILFTLGQGLSISYIMFGVFLFLNGVAHGTGKVIMILYPMEFMGYKYRVIPSCLPANAIALMLIAVLAYFFQDWRYVTCAVAVLGVPLLFTCFVFPESIRFLMVCRRYDEAKKVFRMMARWNGKKEPDLDGIDQIYTEGEGDKKVTGNKTTYMDLFRNKKYARLTAKVAFIWVCFGISYTGQSFAVKEFPGNRYINLAILGCTEGLAQVTGGLTCNLIGRKMAVFAYYTLSICANIALATLTYLGITNTYAVVSLSMVSWFGISGGCAAVFTFTAESYPTVIRSIGYSFCNSFGRLGSILGPQLVYLYHRHPFVSYLTYGGVLILSMITTALVPETNGKELQDIIDEKPTAKPKRYGTLEEGWHDDKEKLISSD